MACIRKAGPALMLGAAGILTLAPPAFADDDVAVAPTPVPHLSSPDNLPPGTVADPPPDTGRLGYLRELWHAVQTQEISGGNALLLLTQLPMDAPAPAMTPPGGPPPPPTSQPETPAPIADPAP
jgi:resuscitation-promoting factor RpfA